MPDQLDDRVLKGQREQLPLTSCLHVWRNRRVVVSQMLTLPSTDPVAARGMLDISTCAVLTIPMSKSNGFDGVGVVLKGADDLDAVSLA